MNYNVIQEKTILHSKAVAEVMYKLADENKEEMYILGLLHDIGKIAGFNNHESYGANLLASMGMKKYEQEIRYHGKVQNEYSSKELDLLNAADLVVDSEGNVVGVTRRLEDIAERYGHESKEYQEAKKLSVLLRDILDKVVVE